MNGWTIFLLFVLGGLAFWGLVKNGRKPKLTLALARSTAAEAIVTGRNAREGLFWMRKTARALGAEDVIEPQLLETRKARFDECATCSTEIAECLQKADEEAKRLRQEAADVEKQGADEAAELKARSDTAQTEVDELNKLYALLK